MKAIRISGITLLLIFIQASAWATIGPPVSLKMEVPDSVPVPGETFRGTLLLEVGSDGWVDLEGFWGEGWSRLQIEGSNSYDLLKGEALSIDFTGLPSKNFGAIELEYSYEGRALSTRFDLRRLDPRGNRRPMAGRLLAADDVQIIEHKTTRSEKPDPAPFPKWRADIQGGPEPQAADDPVTEKRARSITIEGQLVFTQPDGRSFGADGMTVRIYDDDTGPDDHLATGVTDLNGDFSITFTWDPCFLCDGAPDIYVEVESENSIVEVEDPGLLELNYFWETWRLNDFGGSYYDFGQITTDEVTAPAWYISTHILRAYFMIQGVAGYVTPPVDVQWPVGDESAWYTDATEVISVSTEHEWNADVLVHEYGHHWINNFGLDRPPSYCNGFCDKDQANNDCSHCLWCPETRFIAWSEGWPDWLADYYIRHHRDTYAYIPPYRASAIMESQSKCRDIYQPVAITEGAFAALLRDIEDPENDNDARDFNYRDVLTLGAEPIFDLVTQNPDEPDAFVAEFRSAYPLRDEQFWETLKNNGYEYDNTSPGIPTNLSSANHTIGVESAAARIGLNWTPAADDFSGIQGYGVSVTNSQVSAPLSVNVEAGSGWISDPQAPGTWYVNIRAFDRAGNLGITETVGPFIIREAEPADLVFIQDTGWGATVVLRSTPDAAPGNVPFPNNLLTPYPGETYWNTRVQNQGEATSGCCPTIRVRADGLLWFDPFDQLEDEDILSGLGATATDNSLNMGPLGMFSGRHTFTARVDSGDEVSEQDETNNTVGRQYVWSPILLSDGVDQDGANPPPSTGGFPDWTEGSIGFNALGYRFTASGFWNAVVLWADEDDVDYDVRLHDRSDDPSAALISPVGWSSRSTGRTDFVLVNRNTLGLGTWDVAVMQGTGGLQLSDFTTRLTTSVDFAYGDSVRIDPLAGEMLVLREVLVSAANTGLVEVIVETDPAKGPLHVAWFDDAFTRGDVHDAVAQASTDMNGFASFLVDADVEGFYGIAVYRDIRDPNGLSATSFVLQVGAPLPDLAVYQPGNFELPLVPNEDGGFDYFFELIEVSSYLPGWDESAIYTGIENVGANKASGPFQDALWVDDVFLGGPTWATGLSAGSSRQGVTDVIDIPGGRHTVWMQAGSGVHEESNPDNNYFAGQWIYAPADLALGTPMSFAQPTHPNAGWGAFRNPSQTLPAVWFNCHGLRTPLMQPSAGDGNWFVIATLPQGGGDVDLRIHPPSTGSGDGFALPLGTSYVGGPDQLDYYVVNTGLLGPTQYDVGVIHLAGSDGYSALVQESTPLGTPGVESLTTHGPFTLASGEMLHLYEIWLEPGQRTIRLQPLDANADLGLTVSAAIGGAGRGDALLWESWLEPPGAADQVHTQSIQARPWMVMVWKNLGSELGADAGYEITVETDLVTDVPKPVIPSRTRLASAHPNPFNPRTTIAFELAQAGPVQVLIYNLRGELVRTLQEGHLPAGRHERLWNGQDDAGQTVSSGTYLVRLNGSGGQDQAKITLIK